MKSWIAIQDSKNKLKQLTDDFNNVTIGKHDLQDKWHKQESSLSKMLDIINDEQRTAFKLLVVKEARYYFIFQSIELYIYTLEHKGDLKVASYKRNHLFVT